MASEWTVLDDIRELEEDIVVSEANAAAFESKAATYTKRAIDIRALVAKKRVELVSLQEKAQLLRLSTIMTDEEVYPL